MKISKDSFSTKNLLTVVAYCTLLISLVYYISNFSFSSSVSTFTMGSIVWTVVSLTGIVYYFPNGAANNKIFIFAFLYLVYNAVMMLFNFSELRTLLRDLIYNFLWFSLMVLFYGSSKSKGINKWYKIILRIALPVVLFSFITLVNTNQTARTVKTLNPVFYLLYLVPFVLLEDGLFRYIGLLLLFVGILVSNKRTALLAFIIVILYYLAKNSRRENANSGKIFRNLLLGVVLIAGMAFTYNYIMSRYQNIDWLARFQSISEDGGSGRTYRWSKFFIDTNSSSLIQIFFGHGVQPPYYHNDFMQIIYNDGLIGFLFYFVFCIFLIKKWIQMSKYKYKYTVAFGASLIIFIVDSMLGQVVVVPTWILQLGVIWGILLGDFEKRSLEDNF